MPAGSGVEGSGGLGWGARHWRAKGPKGMAFKVGCVTAVNAGVDSTVMECQL